MSRSCRTISHAGPISSSSTTSRPAKRPTSATRRDPKSPLTARFRLPQTGDPPSLAEGELDTLTRLGCQALPPLETAGLRDCQVDAIHGLGGSLAKDHPRALIQMATGAGKTFTACTFSWRLLKFAEANRILFLVDRNNLGDQTLKEYQNYDPPGSGRKFDKTYIVQHLHSNRIDPDAKVVITTIQRLYAMLRGEELDEEAEEASAFETWANEEGELRPVAYNPAIPIETFDFIVTDECHRSIYGLWRQVLEYFDAHLIGLTATPSRTRSASSSRISSPNTPTSSPSWTASMSASRSSASSTRSASRAALVNSEYQVPVRDRRTRASAISSSTTICRTPSRQLDRAVTVPNQIRAVLQCFKDKLFTDLFPGPHRRVGAQDAHLRQGRQPRRRDRPCRPRGLRSGQRLRQEDHVPDHRKTQGTDQGLPCRPFPRIAVTVDMIATGTDIKPRRVPHLHARREVGGVLTSRCRVAASAPSKMPTSSRSHPTPRQRRGSCSSTPLASPKARRRSPSPWNASAPSPLRSSWIRSPRGGATSMPSPASPVGSRPSIAGSMRKTAQRIAQLAPGQPRSRNLPEDSSSPSART